MYELVESVSASKLSGRITKTDKGYLIPGVALLSEFSRNRGPKGKPRRYSESTQTKAASLFEGLRVYVDHPERDESGKPKPRTVRSLAGKVINPRLRKLTMEGRTISQTVGDLLLVEDANTEHIIKLANLDDKIVGMSITGDGDFKESENFDDIVNLEPRSVDIVDKPASTRGLYESEEPHALPRVKTNGKSADDLVAAAVAATEACAANNTVEAHTAAAIRHRAAADAMEKALREALASGNWNKFAALFRADRIHSEASWKHESTARQLARPDPEEAETVLAALEEAATPFGKKPPKEGAVSDDDESARDEPAGQANGKPPADGAEKKPKAGVPPESGAAKSTADADPASKNSDDDPVAPAGGETDGATNEANKLTVKANMEKTSTAHMNAMFGHMKAAGIAWGAGDSKRAMAHSTNADMHRDRYESLKQKEASLDRRPTPMSQDQGASEASPIPVPEGCAPEVARIWEGKD